MTQLTELEAAAEWTRIAEGGDTEAVALIDKYGYRTALEKIREIDLGSNPTVDRWRNRLDNSEALDLTALTRRSLELMMWADSRWPEQLNDLGTHRPIALWARGDTEILSRKSIGIVGSRNASNYGKKIARDLAYEFASRGFVVVSGGAFGIDAEAHRGALLADRPTVIVSAGGVDRPYPRAHESLYHESLECGGAVVSESPPGWAPQRHRFLTRNRIIAALASATIVIEAPYRSGALNTARHAMSIGRDVGAFPGPIDSPSSTGCHELIRNGATLVSSFAHVEELVGTIGEQLKINSPDFFHGSGEPGDDAMTKRVLDALPRRRGAEASSIARVAGLTLPEVLACLGRLNMEGRVQVRHGKWSALV